MDAFKWGGFGTNLNETVHQQAIQEFYSNKQSKKTTLGLNFPIQNIAQQVNHLIKLAILEIDRD